MNLRLEEGLNPVEGDSESRREENKNRDLLPKDELPAPREPAEEKVGKKLTRMTAIAEYGASFMSESPNKPEMQGQ